MSWINKRISQALPMSWRLPIRARKRKADDFMNGLLHRALKILPDQSQVYLKTHLNVVRKMDYKPHDIFLNIDSPVEYRVRLRSAKKEPETIEWLESRMKPGDVLYDVGANVGAYSLVAAKHYSNQVKVYAFEPSFVNFGQLCKNISLNGCGESVIPMSVALSDKTEIGDFHYFNLMAGGALNSFGEAVNDKGERFEATLKHALFSFRADDLVKMFGVAPPTHLKIDVDGLEMNVLKGAEACIARPEARSVIIEVGRPEQAEEVRLFLEKLGFGQESGYKRGRQGTVNYIFSRAESAQTVTQKAG
jgi:FkbM family methyltransferase